MNAYNRGAYSVERIAHSRALAALFLFLFYPLSAIRYPLNVFAQDIREPNVAGQFYPADKTALSRQIDLLLEKSAPERIGADIFCLISPHAGYDFSGQTAAFGYKLIRNKPYKTVVIIGPSHYYGFSGISVYASGSFRTPLGGLEIDSDFTQKIINPEQKIGFIPEAFDREHSVEVQLPFLQKSLADFKIVPIVTGDCGYQTLRNLSENLIKAIGQRKDVLIVASTDLTHSYDYQETEIIDRINLSYLQKMSPDELYAKLKEGGAQMCGGYPVVAAMLTAKGLGNTGLKVLSYDNSAQVTGKKTKGLWTVGYASAVIVREKSEEVTLLSPTQKKRLLEIARGTIEEYLSSGKRLDFKEEDGRLREISGAFVTLHKHKELRGCIGNIIGQKPLFETVRDMAIESATGDPRFGPVSKEELKDIEIEVSVLSPLKKITHIDEFQLGAHGVLVRRGFAQGVFLPQVATETGWSKEEFLSYLCEHKAGLSPDAWKDPATEIFIFSAQVFSE
ncbi:AmmeMemoRadiSam system protein B [bacterium]|nr:MAG: AmmeMemoRadiSam system protein B [bacterium]